MAAKLQFTEKDVLIVDVHYHYLAPHILKPMGEFAIASLDETPDAMTKSVGSRKSCNELSFRSLPCLTLLSRGQVR